MSKKYIGNLVQSLSGGSGGGGGGDTGVGKPYPGSTGGEYFNYYGDDSNKNIASGNYSTTIGYNNKNSGETSFVGGDNTTNQSNRGFVYGHNNTLTSANGATENIIIGGSNSNTQNGTTPQKETFIIGTNNVMDKSGRGNKMFGTGLKDDSSSYQRIYLGTFNAPITNTTGYNKYGGFTLGAGKDTNNRYNAMEIFTGAFSSGNYEVHIPSPFSFSLNTLGNSVNAIIPPQDPNNVTTDDQTLATKSYVDANSGSGGVGQSYSGSTGGEIFNYYGTDSDKNIASGNYSTAHGKKNSCTSLYAFAAGYNNEITSTIDGTAIALGSSNKVGGGTALGHDNLIVDGGAFGSFLDNTAGSSTNGNRISYLVGTANNTTLLFPERSKNYPAALVVGSGAIYKPENAIECYHNYGVANNSLVAFPTSVCLSNKVIVNAITPPQDPNNVTADDQTLVTKSYVKGITVPRSEILLTGQSTTVANGGSVSLETDLSLTLPTWAKQIRMGIHNSGGYVEYLLIDNINAHSYVSVTGAGTIDVYSYDPATTTFTYVSGGASMSIVSIRAEGTTTI